jgi:hypothetical protein
VNAAHVRWVLAAAAVSCALVLPGPPYDLTAAARRSRLTDRVSAYAEQFGREFKGVVAAEHYVQVIRPWTGEPPARPDVSAREALARRAMRTGRGTCIAMSSAWTVYRSATACAGCTHSFLTRVSRRVSDSVA